PLPKLSTVQPKRTGRTVNALPSGAHAGRTHSVESPTGRAGLSISSPLLVPRPLSGTAKAPPRARRVKVAARVPVKAPPRVKTPMVALAPAVPPRRVPAVVGTPELSTIDKPAGAFRGAVTSSLVPGRERGPLRAGVIRPTAPPLAGRILENPIEAVPTGASGAPLLSAATQDVNSFAGAFSAPPRAVPQGGRTSQKPLRPSSPRSAMLLPLTPQSRSRHAAITVSPAAQTVLAAIYVTRRNESLLAVAQRCKLPVAVLAAANKLAPTAQLRKGAQIRLPQPITLAYHGQPVEADVASLMVGSTAVTPFRFLFEQQGGSLTWDGARQRVVARDSKHEVVVTIGSRTAIVNKKETMMNLAAFLMSGRTMVPVRFFEKALHAEVEWEPSTGRLFVAMAG
ncbi:MAG TPA: stalk domain-containing protein, partial [Abditibacteriaceae bacterium]|nr:stalk domain-containing protein [Abditibacteriaceae bacterium]